MRSEIVNATAPLAAGSMMLKMEEGYGVKHKRRRRQWEQRFRRGEQAICPRCGEVVDGEMDWDLDHDDANPRARATVASTPQQQLARAEDIAGVVKDFGVRSHDLPWCIKYRALTPARTQLILACQCVWRW